MRDTQIARDTVNDITVSTINTCDNPQHYQTAIMDGDTYVVQEYGNLTDALDGHDRWLAIISEPYFCGLDYEQITNLRIRLHPGGTLTIEVRNERDEPWRTANLISLYLYDDNYLCGEISFELDGETYTFRMDPTVSQWRKEEDAADANS